MQIPNSWFKATSRCQTPDQRTLQVSAWGWGSNDAVARQEATNRLQRLLDRIRRGESFPKDVYAYATRPLREEIVTTFDGEQGHAIVTRNRYGALVLNTERLLFLDVDLPPANFTQRLRGLFSKRNEAATLAQIKLRETLRQFGRATFRIYRTAAGLRALAIDRDFDPADKEVLELMKATGTDPCFTRLCSAQKSFRARLTPKPWRCRCTMPPGQYPRTEDATRQQFTQWIGHYDQISTRYASCRYLETVGSGNVKSWAEKLIDYHDRVTKCNDALPLA